MLCVKSLLRWTLALICCTASPSFAQLPELDYLYPDQSIWTTRLDTNGNPDNPLLRLASALFDKTGIPWHAKPYPAARLFTTLNDGTPAFSMLVTSPSLHACCLISAKPVASTELRLYRSATTPPIRQREGLRGKRVILLRGYSYGELGTYLHDPFNHIELSVAASHHAAFAILDRGRGDYLLDYVGPAEEVLAQHPVANLQSDLLARNDVHLVLSRNYPNAEAVMKQLEDAAQSLDRAAIMAGRK